MSRKDFYIDGQWVGSKGTLTREIVDPASYEVIGHVSLATAEDVEAAVSAARRAFERQIGPEGLDVAARIALLRRIADIMERRQEDLAQAISAEIGVPISYARSGHAAAGAAHIRILCEEMERFSFEWMQTDTLVTRVPIGVAALITPWNVPVNQIVIKVAPALGAGCAVILKPSEIAPGNARIIAEILDEAGVPPGLFNLIHGDGEGAGAALSSHPDIDMVSFTGSTRAGVAVSRNAAPTVKRVGLELGGKSANILLPDADFAEAVAKGVKGCFANSGQACSAPSRMLVPQDRMEEAAAVAAETAAGFATGDPRDPGTDLGPVAGEAQWTRIQGLIESGIAEGARLVAGGPGLPEGLASGAYVRPTVFADVAPDMAIAQQEIFGPVLSIIGYRDEDDAVRIANGTVYGLAAYVQGRDLDRVRAVGRRLRAGRVHLNYPVLDRTAPFGGFRQSGNGREQGRYGLEEFLEYSALIGHGHG
ncbi:aldehyde dehydrogenase family protein [Mangrovicoccus sp. HB161399]|uniref:aldehyde dehydrogenase family protein n=1 Tax=Mangrovicoccus sp. HB161399 TaxID=2720392 RepID=UPI0015581156|nr:aldehyde dehydrogenase family protein [Mangrovicoccus sp. HB161399]